VGVYRNSDNIIRITSGKRITGKGAII